MQDNKQEGRLKPSIKTEKQCGGWHLSHKVISNQQLLKPMESENGGSCKMHMACQAIDVKQRI